MRNGSVLRFIFLVLDSQYRLAHGRLDRIVSSGLISWGVHEFHLYLGMILPQKVTAGTLFSFISETHSSKTSLLGSPAPRFSGSFHSPGGACSHGVYTLFVFYFSHRKTCQTNHISSTSNPKMPSPKLFAVQVDGIHRIATGDASKDHGFWTK